MQTQSPVFQLGPNITLFPVVHGSGDCAVEVRRLMLAHHFDCLAVPLPPSFQNDVEHAVELLPHVTVVLQRELNHVFLPPTHFGDSDSDESDHETTPASYVPIDPCQPVIAALRIARQERIARAFIDPETDEYLPHTATLPDPYALKRVTPEQFASAVLPAIPRPVEPQRQLRIQWMAARLHAVAARYNRVLCLCSLHDWPWLREAFLANQPIPDVGDPQPAATEIAAVAPATLLFMLGELPWITGLYEQARALLDDDENLSVDGIKALLLQAREHYVAEFGPRARRITPALLSRCLKYARNLSLIERRFTPDLYSLVIASQQTTGDQFAIHLTETARLYPWTEAIDLPQIRFGINRAETSDGTRLNPKSRLPGNPVVWRTCNLSSRPDRDRKIQWQSSWNPFGQCSWPPEDVAIERFRNHVKDVAIQIMGSDLARTEKFSSSMKDGLDMRETLRNWHTGSLYVREFPPARGRIDCVVMLFDSPADPRLYPWRITWHAEAHDESTLALFATNFLTDMVGPGIALARYGGAMFLFPPRPVPEIWHDPRFDFTDTLEERLLAAALFHSREKQIALLSAAPPGAGWRRLAARFKRRIIHVPLSRFGAETIEKLRMVHVLNGHEVRSWADKFIRRP